MKQGFQKMSICSLHGIHQSRWGLLCSILYARYVQKRGICPHKADEVEENARNIIIKGSEKWVRLYRLPFSPSFFPF